MLPLSAGLMTSSLFLVKLCRVTSSSFVRLDFSLKNLKFESKCVFFFFFLSLFIKALNSGGSLSRGGVHSGLG